MIDYLPDVLKTYREFKGITDGQQWLFNNLWTETDKAFADQYVETATEHGISNWEAILKITPKGTDTLEARRFRVKTRLNEELPYTYRWLVNWLQSLCGPDNPVPVVDGYTLHVSLPSRVDYAGILDELRRRIPANLVIAPHIRLAGATSKLFIGSAVRLSTKQSMTVLAVGDDRLTAFTDDGGAVITDEHDKILYVEDTL